ncbi:FtsK/SpoIIIE domain-containing protein [Mechercharimyces sp. CAU 1602]|uniref:FtsK/SpoIIIE domain-containing protein n=1 Tax=Mechercharimyces sp. CAU 1602 TaxID=2973933 RepID=UPI002161F06D|nr:FtsK/SpoIIIE domain-containing protein [Mechercharimyces sp. CAU 1602]
MIAYSGIRLFHLTKESRKVQSVLRNNGIEVTENNKKKRVRVRRISQAQYGSRLYLKLPEGISSEDIEKCEAAINESLRKDIEIRYEKEEGVYIDIYDADLPEEIEYSTRLLRNDYKVPIGVDHLGETIYYDFEGSYPHLLVGGIAGGGKSVLLRSILTSLALKTKTDLYLTDLKGGVELGLFRSIEHTKGFSTTLGETAKILGKVEREMERRYEILRRNESQQWKGKRVIFVMDELADLKERGGEPKQDRSAKHAIKSSLARISAKGRAAGVILVLCTQRPSADIVDGLIKTNISTSVCFRTRDNIQSRIILDHGRASELPGIPGRCMYQQTDDLKVQTFHLSYANAKKLLKDVPKRQEEQEHSEEVTEVERGTQTAKVPPNESGTIDVDALGLFDRGSTA